MWRSRGRGRLLSGERATKRLARHLYRTHNFRSIPVRVGREDPALCLPPQSVDGIPRSGFASTRPFNPFVTVTPQGAAGGSGSTDPTLPTSEVPGGRAKMKDFEAQDFHPASDFDGPHAVLIDGTALVKKAFVETPLRKRLVRSDGQHLNAVYRCTTILMSFVRHYEPENIALVLDHQLPVAIQNQPNLATQVPIVEEAAAALGVPVVRVPGHSSEDAIASYSRMLSENGHKVTLVSPMITRLVQLVEPHVTIYDLIKGKVIDEAEVQRRFNVTPRLVPSVQALVGASDLSVAGIPKIGVKTASSLIGEYQGAAHLLNNLDHIKSKDRRTRLESHKYDIQQSLEKLTLSDDIPSVRDHAFDLIPTLARAPYEIDRLVGFFEDQEFRSLLSQLAQLLDSSLADVDPDLANDGQYHTLTDSAVLQDWLDTATGNGGVIAVSLFTTDGPDGHNHPVVGFSLAAGEAKNAIYVPFGHTAAMDISDGEGNVSSVQSPDAVSQMSRDEALKVLVPFLEDESIKKTAFDSKYIIKLAKTQFGVTIRGLDDVSILSYINKCGSIDHHDFHTVVEFHLGVSPIQRKHIVGIGKKAVPWAETGLPSATTFAGQEADYILRLHNMLRGEMEKVPSLHKLYNTIEHPLIRTIADMEIAGVYANKAELGALSDEYGARMEEIEERVYAAAPHPFNISSPKQLGSVMFDEMPEFRGAKVEKSAKTGLYSTSSKVLLELANEGHTFCRDILDYREVSKLRSTYCQGLLDAINPVTDRVHTTFLQAGTSTGRLASIAPNLQNIPVRTAEGRRIRACFTARPGHKLIFADYSQMELRMLAHVANIDALKTAFADEVDVHTLTASQVFGVPTDEVDSTLRQRAKTINFGIIYGMSEYGLRKNLGVTLDDAREYIASYFKQYPGIQKYMDEMKANCYRDGYVTTLFGRRCWIPEINSNNPKKKQNAERAAINTPIQGSSADIAKIAMLRMHACIKENRLASRLLLQVHDELILESPDEEVDELVDLVRNEMVNAVSETEFTVPMTVDVNTATKWEK